MLSRWIQWTWWIYPDKFGLLWLSLNDRFPCRKATEWIQLDVSSEMSPRSSLIWIAAIGILHSLFVVVVEVRETEQEIWSVKGAQKRFNLLLFLELLNNWNFSFKWMKSKKQRNSCFQLIKWKVLPILKDESIKRGPLPVPLTRSFQSNRTICSL